MKKRPPFVRKRLELFFDALNDGKSSEILYEDRITDEDVRVAKAFVEWSEGTPGIDITTPDPEEPGNNYSVQFFCIPERPIFRMWSKRTGANTGGARDVEIFFVNYNHVYLFGRSKEDRAKRKAYLDLLFDLVPSIARRYRTHLNLDGRKNIEYSTFYALEDFNGFTQWVLRVAEEMKKG
jgi:hypothetical protein